MSSKRDIFFKATYLRLLKNLKKILEAYWIHYEKFFFKFCWHDEKFIIDPKVLACEGTRFNLTDVMNTSKKMIVILQLLSFFIITYWFGWNRTISTCKLSCTPNKTYELIVIQRPYTLSNMTSPLGGIQ